MNWIATTFLLISSVAQASDSTAVENLSALDSAEIAYVDEDYENAYLIWEEYASNQTLPSADLYYNMGNAAWRMEEVGEAIWRWNQALKLNPDMEDAAHNLELAQSKLIDNIKEEEQDPLTYGLQLIYTSLSPRSWAIIGMTSFILMVVFLAIRKYSNSGFRRSAPVLAIFALSLSALSITLGVTHQYYLDNHKMAVVLNANLHVKSAPMAGAADAFIIHEGSEMKVTQQIGDWIEIRLGDGKVGWIEMSEVGVY